MDPLAQLGMLATIAATYSGFIAVFIAFTKDGRFEGADGHFVQAMVLGTIGVIVMSLSPPVLTLLIPPPCAWYWMSWFGIAGGVPSLFYQIWHHAAMPRDEAKKIPPGWHIPGWLFGSFALLAFILAVWLPDTRIGAYVAGVTMMLATAIWCFIAVVFRRFF